MGSTIALLEARLPGVREQRRQLEDQLAAVIAQEDAMVGVLQGLETLSDTVLDGASTAAQGPAVAADAAPAEVTGTGPAPEVAEPSVAGAVDEPVGEEPVSRPEAEPVAARPVRKRTAKRTAVGTTAAKNDTAKKTTVRKAVAKNTSAAEATDAAAVPDTAEPAVAAKKAAVRGAGKATAKKAAAEKTAPVRKAATKRSAPAKKTVATDKPAPVEEAPAASAPAAPSGRRRRLTDAASVLAVLAGASGPLRAREVTGLLGLEDQEASVNAVRTMLERLAKTGKAQRSGRGLYATVSAG
ncbi:hypothetical protein [Kitasatospora sp. NPDC057015]|uniref:hypothetical protein n=1 Tax=Kitasatospora sp. NPDC057015 TaxID=3346001 RepID=UPI00362FB146